MNTAEAAKLLNISVARLRVLIRQNRIQATKDGHGNRATYILDPASVAAYKPMPAGRPRKKP
jgi:excisionase family DNA binding protein